MICDTFFLLSMIQRTKVIWWWGAQLERMIAQCGRFYGFSTIKIEALFGADRKSYLYNQPELFSICEVLQTRDLNLKDDNGGH